MIVEDKYDTFRLRVAAAIIDGFVLLPITLSIQWLYTLNIESHVTFLIFLFESAYFYLYSFVMHGMRGQTVGKIYVKVKVLDVAENKLGYKRAALRDGIGMVMSMVYAILVHSQIIDGIDPDDIEFNSGILTVFAYFTVIWFITELVTMLFNNKRRALHDFIAGSVVVKCA